MHENEIGRIVVDCAVRLHMELGPGLLESVYEVLLCHRIRNHGLTVDRQVPIPLEWDNVKFDVGFSADLIVAGKVVIELKSIERIQNAHRKQVLTYLKVTGMRLGYLLNFGEAKMKNGIVRVINGSLM